MKNKLIRNQKGFTITEMLVVLVIIGILSTWSIPKYMQVLAKAKMTECKINLEHIASLEEVYYQERQCYAKTADEVGYDMPSSKYFNYLFTADSNSFTIEAVVKVTVKGPGGKDLKGMRVSVDEAGKRAGDEALRQLVGW
ncbi:MAG: hypothetical protein A2293_12360 [Elusimicrobia bacterium RIFOXYB2_FULL_49_7]|nr:MAG: hypothetical protein A2293_12360 [Elusimicrobia bacterium RIFOXYB2_FULL_49_7]